LVALKGWCRVIAWRAAVFGHDPANFASRQSKGLCGRAKNGDL
jgi:hypothetical protein